ncbi:amidohydrolase family protein [Pontibacter sp. G13]|uniref:amidohydrolase family protein n=1 Tax=Pontibacter sp. G13 TaxID=3074898 RepID=UPI00288BCFF3|nr:amidohydrolase family protein [Pontibacter sp. G13]WNJ16280.1 amidohydrolase family protein [Pontibacter sp. G13]
MTSYSFRIQRCVWMWICMMGVVTSLQAQNPSEQVMPVTGTYAITGAYVVPAPGQVIAGGTVLIQDGLIVEVGTSVKIPGHARIIQADSMYVYAGFIDGFSHAGIPKPKEPSRSERPKVKNPGTPPDNLAGIMPQRQVRDLMDPKDKSIAELRAAGFTAAHIAPHGKMLPGQSAFILTDGSHADEMIYQAQSGLYARFQGASGMYPNTVIGVMAKFRDLYRSAEGLKQHEVQYASSAVGMARPPQNQVLQAFFPVIDQSLPVFFETPKLLDAHRAMALQRDLGFPLVLAGLEQGGDLIPQLSNGEFPVILSLELPDEVDEEDAPNSGKASVNEERDQLFKRKLEAYEQYVSQAGKFAQANIPFAFSTAGVKTKEIRKNLQVMVEYGLDEATALAALTTVPAELMGVSDVMGTLEAGKMANVIVTTQPFLAQKSQVKYVWVDGHFHEYEAKKKKKSAVSPDAPVEAAGLWSFTVESPQGTVNGTLKLSGSEGDYEGTISTDMSPDENTLESIELEGNILTFSYSLSMGGDQASVDGELELDGDTFEGTLSVGNFGSFPIEGTREGGPQ